MNLQHIDPEKAGKIAQTITATAGTGTGTLGVWTWFGQNADTITAICAIFGAVCTGVGLVASLYFAWRRDRRERQ